MTHYKRIGLTGKMKLLTGAAVSYADSRREGTKLFLDRLKGKMAIQKNTMKGALRHVHGDMVQDTLLAMGIGLSLNDYNMLCSGLLTELGNKKAKKSTETEEEKKKSKKIDFDVLELRPDLVRHPLALWGFWIAGAGGQIQIEPVIFDGDPDVIMGQRVDSAQRGWIDPSKLSDPAEYHKYIEKLRNMTAADSDKLRINTPFSREIIPIGSVGESNIDVLDTTDVHFGALLATLRKFAEAPYFGAKMGMNGGLIDLEYTVIIGGDEIGSIKIDGRKRSFSMDDSLVPFETAFWQAFETTEWRLSRLLIAMGVTL